MTAYLNGLQLGISAADSTMAAGERERSYKDSLVARDAARDVAEEQRDQAGYQFEVTSDETKRHNMATEAEWGPPGSRGSRGGAGMTPEQRMSISRGKIISDHTRNQIAGVEESPEQLAAYQTAVADEHDYLHPGGAARGSAAKAAADAAAKAKADAAAGDEWGITKAIKSGMDYFSAPGAPAAPPAQTMSGMLNGKRVKLTKTAAGWADETGQVHK